MFGMLSRSLRVLAILALATHCSSQTYAGWVLHEDGIGPVKIAMTKPQLNAALREKLSEEGESGSESCYYLASHKHPHIGFMMIDERLVRIDVNGANVPTPAGIRVGDSEAHVKKIYGPAVKIDAHQYIDDGHYLTVRSKNGKNGIRFETDKGRVTTFYAGTFDAIQYVEGCL